MNLDALTYAGNVSNLKSLHEDARHHFVRGDIADRALINALLAEHRPRAIVHFAAESHVDRSILGPAEFVRTNIQGTFTLLEAARAYWGDLPTSARAAFRFLHVSTDEVYGSLGPADEPFTEKHPYRPNSPYAASKAASDHWRARGTTPMVCRCSTPTARTTMARSISREADPADDHQCARRQAAAGLWRRAATCATGSM